MNKDILLQHLLLNEKSVEGLYVFGSRAYGTASEERQSDYDLIMILKTSVLDNHERFRWKSVNWLVKYHWINPEFRHLFSNESDKTCFVDLGDRNAQIWMFNIETFRQLLNTNTMFAIECIFLPDDLKWIEKRKFSQEFHIDNSMLQQSVINHSRSHLLMARKNLTQILFPLENNDMQTNDNVPIPENYDFYKTKKLIWHSIRLLYFGIHLKQFGQIKDYTLANHLYEDILHIQSHRWIDIESKYIPIYHQLIEQFLKLTT